MLQGLVTGLMAQVVVDGLEMVDVDDAEPVMVGELVRLAPVEAFAAGVDCARNGPNMVNCNFRHFASREQTDAWERGKRKAHLAAARKKGAKHGKRPE